MKCVTNTYCSLLQISLWWIHGNSFLLKNLLRQTQRHLNHNMNKLEMSF